jgi:hypothetical protein
VDVVIKNDPQQSFLIVTNLSPRYLVFYQLHLYFDHNTLFPQPIQTMKVAPTLLLGLSIVPAAIGCLHTYGELVFYQSTGYKDVNIQIVDNNVMVCDSRWGWRTNQDGNVSP